LRGTLDRLADLARICRAVQCARRAWCFTSGRVRGDAVRGLAPRELQRVRRLAADGQVAGVELRVVPRAHGQEIR
jgi:hypothetical protein